MLFSSDILIYIDRNLLVQQYHIGLPNFIGGYPEDTDAAIFLFLPT